MEIKKIENFIDGAVNKVSVWQYGLSKINYTGRDGIKKFAEVDINFTVSPCPPFETAEYIVSYDSKFESLVSSLYPMYFVHDIVEIPNGDYIVNAQNQISKKNFIMKFSADNQKKWGIDIPTKILSTHAIRPQIANNYIYVIISGNKKWSKWLLYKISLDGEIVETVEIDGFDLLAANFNDKLVILYCETDPYQKGFDGNTHLLVVK
jgi:hypothetical protein